jgi:hypothetical protein
VASETWPIDGQSVESRIPDLREIPLGQLAALAAGGEKDVTGVVERIRGGLGNPSGFPAMTFQSAI